MADIFVSYASLDRERVRPLVEALQLRGWSVWWDRDIQPGSAFEQTIDREISAARCVVVAWSREAIESRWVRNEALEGLERDVLVPVLLDDVRIPVAFRQTQAVDLRSGIEIHSAEWTTLVSAIEVRVDDSDTLQTAIASPPLIERPTIAVLPFQTSSQDVADQFLVHSLVIELTGRLAHVPGFFVISAGTMLGFQGSTIDPAAIGRSLGVQYVVEGSLRRSSKGVRVQVRLTDALRSTQLWAQRLDVDGEALEDIEDEIIDNLLGCIEPALARSELARISHYRPADMNAWMLCQKAIAVLQVKGWHEDVLKEAAAMLDQSAAKDPRFALPVAAKSVILGVGQRLAFWIDEPTDLRTESLAAAHRGIEMADGNSQSLGYAGCAMADWGQTEESFPILDLAIEQDPSNAQAHMARSIAWRDLGQIDRAVEDGGKALRMSPRDTGQANWLMGQAANLLLAGKVEDATAHARLSIQRDPRYFGGRVLLALTHIAGGEHALASKAMQDARRLRSNLTRRQLRALLGKLGYSTLESQGLVEDLEE